MDDSIMPQRRVSAIAAGYLALVLAAFVNGPAQAAERVEVDANGGMQVIFTHATTYNNTCDSADPPRHKIRKQAAHGTIVTDIVKTTFPATHKRCAGKPVQVFVVGYRPNRGYRGKDSATVSMSATAYSNESFRSNRTLRFVIDVK